MNTAYTHGAAAAPRSVRDRAQVLLEMNNAIASHLELAPLLKAVSECLRRELPHDFAGLAIYDPEIRQLRALLVPLTEMNQPFANTAVSAPLATLEGTEPEHIIKTLRETKGILAGPNGAASRLGLKRTTLQYRITRHHPRSLVAGTFGTELAHISQQ